ncbi:MAG: hypothetical protein PHE50_00170 [Dehalococcoidales bacterium]|nr:hypothetical protein [Dehalococcoidales bacterium]
MITYKDGYKYQLKEDYTVETDIYPDKAISTDYIKLTATGMLTIKKNYAWDGPSGPSIDTKNFMRGSLAHDALYQMMREKYLDHARFRDKADRLLEQLCIEDGMSFFRAGYTYLGVKYFGDPFADPANEKPLITAP